jgi:hypothetical protein
MALPNETTERVSPEVPEHTGPASRAGGVDDAPPATDPNRAVVDAVWRLSGCIECGELDHHAIDCPLNLERAHNPDRCRKCDVLLRFKERGVCTDCGDGW